MERKKNAPLKFSEKIRRNETRNKAVSVFFSVYAFLLLFSLSLIAFRGLITLNSL
jgi:hypothetical protein